MKIDTRLKVPTDRRRDAEILPNRLEMADWQTPHIDSGHPARICFGSFVLDFQRGTLFEGETEIALRPKTFDFLCHLVRNADRLVSKDELLATIWPNVVVTEDSLVQCVTELRRVLGNNDLCRIRTVQKRGYRFETSVSVEPQSADFDRTVERGHEATPIAEPGTHAKRPIWTLIAVGTSVLGGIIALFTGFCLYWQFGGKLSTPPPLSIVVLPFTNLSGDPDQEYFAAGITADLTADLSRLPDTFVIAPATAQTFKGKQIDARQVSRELNVRYLLEGNVRRADDDIRINVQLIDGNSGSTRWAERFDRKRGQIAEWQDEIVGRIAIALDHRLTMLESERVLRERPTSPEAFDLAARGWALVYASKKPENYYAARALFMQAIERDHRAVNARAGVAWSSGISLLNGWSKSEAEDAGMARAAVAELLAHDPNHVIAYQVRGFLLRYEQRTEAAREAFATAVAINPNFAPGHAQLGVTELELGRPEEAVQSAERAIRLSPRDPNVRSWFAFIGMAMLHLGRDAEAITWLSRAIDADIPIALHQAYYVSALALAGRAADARLALAQFRKARPSATISGLRTSARSTNPNFVAQRERLYDGLRTAGLPEQRND